MKRTVCFIGLVCALCLALASCASSGAGASAGSGSSSGTEAKAAAGKGPEYLIMAKSDNGFVAAYRAYFALDGNSITEISSRKYEDLTLGSDTDYEVIRHRTYAFDVTTRGSDPLEWQYKQNEYDDKKYDTQLLIWDLKQMKLPYTGTLYVLVTSFDDYRVILVANMDGNSVLDESYAMFRDEERLALPKGAKLYGLSSFHKRK
ncbi:MAG: hypothetical protein II837_09095 [Treponema sp.]|nr:hypothetical protein [Treponema sp.]